MINLCVLDTRCSCISCVMVLCLTSLQVKWCSDKCSFEGGNKMQTARCQSQTVWRMVQSSPTKFQVCSTVCACGWALSWRKTAPLLRRQGCFLLMASFKLLGMTQSVTTSYKLMFHKVHQQHPSPRRKWPALYKQMVSTDKKGNADCN